MPAPYDYSIPMPDPTQGFLQGLQVAQALEQQKVAQQQADRRADVMRRLQALGQQATAQDYINASLELPEDRELFMGSWDMMEEGKREAIFKAGSEAYTLLSPGSDGTVNTQAALDRLEEYALGFENSGDRDTARQLRDAAAVVRQNPAAGRTTIGTVLAFADGDRFKNVADATGDGDNTFMEKVRNLTPLVGPEMARRLVVGEQAAKGVVSVTGPAGSQFVRAEEVFGLPPGQQPTAVADVATSGGTEPVTAEDAGRILATAAETRVVTEAEAARIRQSMGPNGAAQFDAWLRERGIAIEKTVDGKKYYKVGNRWFDNPEGR
jgi:hypothetical protein